MAVNIYSLLILIGALHGLVLSFLLLISRKNNRSGNILLALLLILYTLPVLRVVLIDVNFFTTYGVWYLSIELLYGLGPSLYLYAKTVTDPNYALRKGDLLHFLPIALELIYYLSPAYSEHHNYFFAPAKNARHLLWMIQQLGGVCSVLIYLGLTNRSLWVYRKWVKNNYSDTHNRTLDWLQIPILLYTSFFSLWFSIRIIDVLIFNDHLTIAPYYPALVFLSFSTYWIGTKGYLQTQINVHGFQMRHEKPAKDMVEDIHLEPIYKRLTSIMLQKELFKENDLSLTQLAEYLEISPKMLSKVINTKSGMNFYDFVNGYRIEEFKRQVSQPHPHRNLIDLAYESGFGSKATFNHVFKKSTGLTPSQYKKRYSERIEKP